MFSLESLVLINRAAAPTMKQMDGIQYLFLTKTSYYLGYILHI